MFQLSYKDPTLYRLGTDYTN
ncbi:TPA: hypothetical protein ANIA_11536 [Aspergillus nidulans FGSC A4]|uniref:Uncharacterized protein n=1 Tax=Emericella nidulans (strain FGSC A4 / ATCC 38163 / CBS 112.46 / NRRL 194 / M139) TaxID=227321 RepID=C8V399_EMENI|nr:TPA: hypothetical protein ANIA_11536 [Aspergillus nidulans FGSC A4]